MIDIAYYQEQIAWPGILPKTVTPTTNITCYQTQQLKPQKARFCCNRYINKTQVRTMTPRVTQHSNNPTRGAPPRPKCKRGISVIIFLLFSPPSCCRSSDHCYHYYCSHTHFKDSATQASKQQQQQEQPCVTNLKLHKLSCSTTVAS